MFTPHSLSLHSTLFHASHRLFSDRVYKYKSCEHTSPPRLRRLTSNEQTNTRVEVLKSLSPGSSASNDREREKEEEGERERERKKKYYTNTVGRGVGNLYIACRVWTARKTAEKTKM